VKKHAAFPRDSNGTDHVHEFIDISPQYKKRSDICRNIGAWSSDSEEVEVPAETAKPRESTTETQHQQSSDTDSMENEESESQESIYGDISDYEGTRRIPPKRTKTANQRVSASKRKLVNFTSQQAKIPRIISLNDSGDPPSQPLSANFIYVMSDMTKSLHGLNQVVSDLLREEQAQIDDDTRIIQCMEHYNMLEKELHAPIEDDERIITIRSNRIACEEELEDLEVQLKQLRNELDLQYSAELRILHHSEERLKVATLDLEEIQIQLSQLHKTERDVRQQRQNEILEHNEEAELEREVARLKKKERSAITYLKTEGVVPQF